MKIALVTAHAARKFGGPPAVVENHFNLLQRRAQVQVYAVADAADVREVEGRFPGARVFLRGFPGRWFRGIGLEKALRQDAHRLDLIHAHMLWDHAVLVAARTARDAGIPLVLSPHGCTMEKRRYNSFYKKIYRKVILEKVFDSTSVVHALNHAEEKAIRNFGYSKEVVVIPNGIPEGERHFRRNPLLIESVFPQLKGKKVAVYMGRLWSGKGLDMLVEAWKVLPGSMRSRWMLALAGPDYRGYKAHIQGKVEALQLQKEVVFCGELRGEQKASLLDRGDFFVLPSHSEAFSVALLEAMSTGLPLLVTDKCNFSEASSVGAAIEVRDDPESLRQGLLSMLSLSASQRTAMGMRGKKLGMRNFSPDKVGESLMKLYGRLCQARHRSHEMGHASVA